MTPEKNVTLKTHLQAITGWAHAATFPSEFATKVARHWTDGAIALDPALSGDLLEEILAAKRDVECAAAIDAFARRVQELVAGE